jgi:hypothetical protein
MARWTACLARLAHHNPYLEAYVKHVIVGRIGFVPEWRSSVRTYCDEILHAMADGVLPSDGRSDLLASRQYFEIVRRNLTALGSEPIEPGFIQKGELYTEGQKCSRWPEYYIRQQLIYEEFHGRTTEVLGLLDDLVAAMFRSGDGEGALEAASAHLRRALQERDDHHEFAARANVASIRHWLGDATEAPAWYAGALQQRHAEDLQVRSGLERRLPHALWDIEAPRMDDFPRQYALDLFDALAMKRQKPQSGEELERTAIGLVKETNFLMGRLLALEAISAFRDEGDPAGVNRCFALLTAMASRDARSVRSPMALCREPILFMAKGEPDVLI